MNTPRHLRLNLQEITSFLGVGGISAIAHYGVLIAFTELLSVSPLISSTLGFISGGIVNYLLNYHFTFRSEKAHSAAIQRFFIVAFTGMVINTGLMAVFYEWLDIQYLLAQVVTTAFVTLWTYIMGKKWTFV